MNDIIWYPINTPSDWPKPWERVFITVKVSPSGEREVVEGIVHPTFGWMDIVTDEPLEATVIAWASKPIIDPYTEDLINVQTQS